MWWLKQKKNSTWDFLMLLDSIPTSSKVQHSIFMDRKSRDSKDRHRSTQKGNTNANIKAVANTTIQRNICNVIWNTNIHQKMSKKRNDRQSYIYINNTSSFVELSQLSLILVWTHSSFASPWRLLHFGESISYQLLDEPLSNFKPASWTTTTHCHLSLHWLEYVGNLFECSTRLLVIHRTFLLSDRFCSLQLRWPHFLIHTFRP